MERQKVQKNDKKLVDYVKNFLSRKKSKKYRKILKKLLKFS